MRDRYASLREGLVGAWIPSVSGSGLLLPDLSGNGNNGALTNMGPEDWVSSQYGRALDFDGSGDRVLVLNSGQWHQSDFTFTCWAYFRGNGASNYGTVISKDNSATNWFFLSRDNFSRSGKLSANFYDGSNNTAVASLQILSLGAWYHIGAVVAGDTCSLFINGQQDGSGSISSWTRPAIPNHTLGFWNISGGRSMDGQLDDARIYNRALSESEIKLLSQEPGVGFKRTRSVFDFGRKPAYLPPTPADYRTVRVKQTEHASLREGLVGAWCPSIEGSGYTLPDLSGNGNNGTLTNMGPEDWVAGEYGRALDFDGVNDYVKCQRVPLTGSGDISISLWVMQAIIRSSDHAIKFGTATTNNAIGIFNSSGNKLAIGLHANNPSEAILPAQLTASVFYHVVGTCKPTQRQIWLDGDLKATSTATVSYNITSTFCHIGAAQSALVPWNGQLDDIRIYNRALSESEIKLLASRPGIGLKPQRRTMYYAPPTGARRRRILTSMP